MTSYSKHTVLRAPWEFRNAANRARQLADELETIVDVLRRSVSKDNHPASNINIDSVIMLAHGYNAAVVEVATTNLTYRDHIEIKKDTRP